MEVDVHRVRTAENVGVGWDTAGIGSRGLAYVLDMSVVGLAVFVLDMLVLGVLGETGIGLIIATAFVPFFSVVGYFVIAETATGGRTPAKRMLQLRVIRADGGAPGLQEALVRGLVRIIDAGVGIIPMFLDSRSRRLGDFAAGTLVVRDRRRRDVEQPQAPVLLRSPDPGPPIDGIARLGGREQTALRIFLSRSGLSPARRTALATEIATRLVDRLELPPTAPERWWPPELLLERLYLQLSMREGRW